MAGAVKVSTINAVGAGLLAHFGQVTKRLETASRRTGKAIDRAIRQLEDCHRGQLPYMRHQPVIAPSLQQLRQQADAEALKAAVAALKHSTTGTVQQIKAAADELAAISHGFQALSADVADPAGMRKTRSAKTRSEPILASSLDSRLRLVAENAALKPKAAIKAGRS